jgi:hypothetical protein
MTFKLLLAAASTAVFALVATPAGAACCEMRIAKADVDIVSTMLTADPQITPAPAARQVAEVWFRQPVFVGRSILQGRYLIDHDDERMARGEPCTHIYAYDDREQPVAAFHCTHLERDRAHENIVVLVMGPDGRTKRLSEFQFAGDTAAHGYPTGR